MLAQSFLRPEALGISEKEHRALVKVLGMLDRGELKFGKGYRRAALFSEVFARPKKPQAFQMALVASETECGTACCIIGWARILSKDERMFARRLSSELKDLCGLDSGECPSPARWNYGNANIEPAQAAIALRNYLTTGEPRWDEALAS